MASLDQQDVNEGGGGGVEPQAKKRRTPTGGRGSACVRLINVKRRINNTCNDESIENEHRARQKLKFAGFDPDDLNEPIDPEYEPMGVDFFEHWTSITPMMHFCYHGDLPMCRYLFAHGGSTTAPDEGEEVYWFPMYVAAHQGRLDVCKWLFEHGAECDIHTINEVESRRPLNIAATKCRRGDKYIEVTKWLILNGAVHYKDEIDHRILTEDLAPDSVDERPRILTWAQDVLQSYDGFQAFLMGTLPPPDFSIEALGMKLATQLNSEGAAKTIIGWSTSGDQQWLLWKQIHAARYQTPVQCLSGNIGILKLISDFAGVVRDSSEIQIHRQLAEVLPAHIEYVF